MAGEDPAHEVAAYLSRLTGQTVSLDTQIGLRSVHRAAFSSWARKQGLALNATSLGSGAAMTVRELLGTGSRPSAAAEAPPPEAAPPGTGSPLLVGIDIESVDALPEAADYREHAFYADHFTAGEIAYCITQPSARTAFAGMWAAKEAVLKSGVLGSLQVPLTAIEIGHDTQGRPTCRHGQLSISHTPQTAVAVCIALAAVAAPPPLARPLPADAPRPHQPAAIPQTGSRVLTVAVCLLVLLAGSALALRRLYGS